MPCYAKVFAGILLIACASGYLEPLAAGVFFRMEILFYPSVLFSIAVAIAALVAGGLLVKSGILAIATRYRKILSRDGLDRVGNMRRNI